MLPECENFLNTLSPKCSQQIKLKCLDFYKTAIRQMLKRLPYNNLFEQLYFLEPKIALYVKGRVKIKDLTYIADQIKSIIIDITKLAFEWRILPSIFDEE